MMKRMLLLMVYVLLNHFSQAQNVDLDKFVFKASTRDFPTHYVPAEQRSFDINIAVSPSLQGFVNGLDEKINIEGFRYSNNNPTIKIYGNINSVKLGSSNIKSRVKETKDKNGKVTSSKTVYYTEARFIGLGDYTIEGPINRYIPLKQAEKQNRKKSKKEESLDSNPFLTNANVDTKDASGNVLTIDTRRMDMRREYSYTSSECDSYSEANRNWENSRDRELFSARNNYLNEFARSLQSTLQGMYGFPVITDNYHLWILDSKSHPEYDMQQKAIEAVKVLMPKLNGNADINALKSELNPVLNYFKSITDKYTKTEKVDKKMGYAAYFNLMKLYYLFDDTKTSKIFADLLIKNDYETQDG